VTTTISISGFHRNSVGFGNGGVLNLAGNALVAVSPTAIHSKTLTMLDLPDAAGKGGKAEWDSLGGTIGNGTEKEVLRIRLAVLDTSHGQSGNVFGQISDAFHWAIVSTGSSGLWAIENKNGVSQDTFSNPFSTANQWFDVEIIWENKASGDFEMKVDGVSITSVNMDMDRSTTNSRLRLFGTFNAATTRDLRCLEYIIDTDYDEGTDPAPTLDWTVSEYQSPDTDAGDTGGDGTGSAETTNLVGDWSDLSAGTTLTQMGYNNPNGLTGAGSNFDASAGGPLNDTDVTAQHTIVGGLFGGQTVAVFGTSTMALHFGKFNGSTVTQSAGVTLTDGQASTNFFVASASIMPGKTESAWMGIKKVSGTAAMTWVEVGCFIAYDIGVPGRHPFVGKLGLPLRGKL